ncbi:beta-galactosidase [Granulicella cerasi]|uniref:Beta-galactosidase n=1 Tax=Granulicella cerasi TaxID=741063 RepID=A0ABW1Z3Q1_9BACT|nr:beta-galactosidase [Granulicella cerasi]
MAFTRRTFLQSTALAAAHVGAARGFGLHALSESAAVRFDARSLIVHGKRVLLLCGELHYSRSTPEMWPALLDHCVALGLNAISTYCFWNIHEPQPGHFHFTEDADLRLFLRLCAERKLFVFLRVGPYCCAEWNFGGFPVWLRDVPGITFRTLNAPYQQRVASYLTRLTEEVRPFLASNGGPIVLVQVENEYSHISKRYGAEGQQYLRWMVELAERIGLGKVPLTQCEGSAQGALATANSDTVTPEHVDEMHVAAPNAPALWSELYPSWYALWGQPHPTPRQPQTLATAILNFLSAGGAGFNYYMWHGGTNFGRTAMYLQTTSYDFDAPLEEYGSPSALGLELGRLHSALHTAQPLLLEGARERKALSATQTEATWTHAGDTLTLALDTAGGGTAELRLNGRTLYKTSAAAPPKPQNWTTVATNFSWQHAAEPLPRAAHPHTSAEEPVEQLLLTHDTTDYCWYSTTIEGPIRSGAELAIPYGGDLFYLYLNSQLVERNLGSLYENRGPIVPHSDRYPFIVANHHDNEHDDGYRFVFKLPAMPPGHHRIDLLSVAIGLIKGDWQIGYPMNMERKGIWQGVQLDGKPLHGWTMTPGLRGPQAETAHAADGLTWYTTSFSLPLASQSHEDVYRLDATGLTKGSLELNGHALGRHWLLSPAGSDQPSQRYYHVPRAWLKEHNTLRIFDEQGGTPTLLSLQRRRGG